MAYIPKSKVSILDTPGGEFINKSTGAPYIGKYLELSNGKYYEGSNPSQLGQELIIPLSSNQLSNNRDSLSYNNLKPKITKFQSQVKTIYPTKNIPTEEDYVVGKMIRYFAKKTNELSSPAFEIAADNYKLSPLYDYVSLEWQISGNKRFILIKNFKQIKVASLVIPNIRKLLPNYQYYRSGEKITSVQEVLSRLGTTGQQANGEQSNSQNNTQNESTGDKATGKGNAPGNQTSNQNSGAGAGTTTGGGGGGSSLY